MLALRQAKKVLGIWLVLTILGAIAGFNLSTHLTAVTGVPGSPSAVASDLVAQKFGENADGSFGIIYHFKNGTDAQIAAIKAKAATAVSEIPTAKISYERAIAGIYIAYVGSQLDLNEASKETTHLRSALSKVGLDRAWVTGAPALEHDVRPVLSRDLKVGGAIALFLALLLLIFALGTSRAIVIPFIVALATVASTLGVLFVLAQFTTMVLYIPNVVELIGLGLAIDYSLLIIQRLRFESVAANFDTALATTMRTAGRTVLFSGATVALGLATLILVPVPFVRSLGLAGVVVPLISMAAAVTLQPALLKVMGTRGITPRRFQGFLIDNQLWSKIASAVTKKPLHYLLASMTLLLIAAAPLAALKVAPASLTSVPTSVESAKALDFIAQRAGRGLITPQVLVVDKGSTTTDSPRLALADALSKRSDVSSVATDSVGIFIDPTGQYQRIFVISKYDFGNEKSQQQVRDFRAIDLSRFGYSPDAKLYVGGAAAQGYDFLHEIDRHFPLIVLLIIALAFVVIFRALRSLVLPLKAILLNLISVSATLGLVVLIFQVIGSATAIESWAIVLLFATLFGLSMDYHIFIVARMREAWDRGLSNNDAIAHGLTQTGSVVSAAALIFVGALSGLIFGHLAGLQQLGLGLALGILIDATVVRGLLLPSAMVLLQKWNWWAPTLKQGPTN